MASLADAQARAEQDPTVVAHRNTVDAHAWEGPAGIGDEYFRMHDADPKTPKNMQVHPLAILSGSPAQSTSLTSRSFVATAN